MTTDTQETIMDIIAKKRLRAAEMEKTLGDQHSLVESLKDDADRLEAAYKREVEATAAKCCQLGRLAGYGASEIKHQQESVGNAAKLPDGWKMYDKYQIRHTDGTPLKGKRYFVLRLDSDDPLEAARVAAAMSAYKGETPQGNAAKLREALVLALSLLDLEEGVPYRTVSQKDLDFMKAALAAPPRNCDKYSHDQALRIWSAEPENPMNGCFDVWLYAPATEKEGCAK